MESSQFWPALAIAVLLFAGIVRLVQIRKLNIAYSWAWLGIGAAILLVVLRYDWLVVLTELIGAVVVTTTVFLFAIIAILVICLQFSIVLSEHRMKIKKLTQELAIQSRQKPK